MFDCRPELFAVRALMLGTCLAFLAACSGGGKGAATNSASATIPAPPAGLTATGGDAVVSLSWTGSDEASSYNVKRATSGGGPYTQIASSTSPTYTDSSVTNATTYYYVVSAVDAAGESANSADAIATPEVPAAAPSVPAGLVATAGNAQVSLVWSVSSGAASYKLSRSTTAGGPYSQVATPATAAYADTNLINGTTYYYVVAAVNSAGSSANSAEVSATPDPAITTPATPTGLTATASNAQVSLVWSPSSGASSYKVSRATTSGGPYAQIATPTTAAYADTSVTNGTTYYYVVAAVNSAATSANSAQVNATPDPTVTTPATPTGLTATGGIGQITLAWSATSGAASYSVKRSTTSGGPYSQIATPTTGSYADTSVTNGTTYYYVVAAVNSVGPSADSAQVSATPTVAAVGSITSISPTSGGVGTVVTVTGTNLAGAIPASRCPNSYCSGLTITTGGAQIGTVTDGAFTVVSNTKILYTVPADGATGQLFFGNALGVAYAPTNFTFVPTAVTAAPASLQAVSGSAQVTLTWAAVPNGASYNIKRSTTNGGPYATIANVSSALTYSDGTVTNGLVYYYVVTSVDVVGESPSSPQATATPVAAAAGNVTITVTPASSHAISPYIYGINGANSSTTFPAGGGSEVPANLKFDRLGGNRLTAYNWTTNASNAGSDYLYENDAYLSSSSVAAAVVTNFVSADQAAGLGSLITVQMQGLVAADENAGDTMNMTNPPVSDANRFYTAVDQKSTVSSVPFTTTPPTTGPDVFMDEFIWAVNQKYLGQNIFETSPTTQHVFAELDNEPELWNSTHLEVQGPTPITSDAYIAKTISLTKALKTQFPNLTIFGPVHYGFNGIYAWNGELSPTPSGNNWFIDKYLPAIKTASTAFGKPLVDVYDFHWYSEATDGSGHRVTTLNGPTLTAAEIQAIVQSPRSLWDPSYQENSWITNALGQAIDLLPRLLAKIAAEDPGMKIAITEYNNGGAEHIAGTIAQADNLGVFGAQGLFAANFWSLTTTEPYILAGFRAFRDFDGAGSNFGDTSVQATSSNVSNVSAYVSTDSMRPGRVVIVAINRSNASQTTTITGQGLSGTAHLFQMSAATANSQTTVQPVAAGTQAVSGSSITLTLPAMSVTTVDIY